MSRDIRKKAKALRSLERVKQVNVLDARQRYSDASAAAHQADREYQGTLDIARRLEDEMRTTGMEGAAISVTAWDVQRRFLAQTNEQVAHRSQLRDRAVQRQEQVHVRLKEAMVEERIVQHHAEKVEAEQMRERSALEAKELDEMWLLRVKENDAR